MEDSHTSHCPREKRNSVWQRFAGEKFPASIVHRFQVLEGQADGRVDGKHEAAGSSDFCCGHELITLWKLL